jgi:aspartate-semialdehyde dehydrogenase
MAEELRVAVVGAASLAGREIVSLLEERQFPLGELRLLGSLRTAGKEVERAGRTEKVALLGAESFDGIDVAFFAGGPALAGEHAPVAVAAGAAVIDLSSRFRLDEDVPLVVPEINSAAIAERRERGIVANPSSTAIALALVLAPLAAETGLRRVVVSTYQGVASMGQLGMEALSRETIELLNARGPRRTRFARRIAFNCVPQVGAVEPGGVTTHELQAVEETRKILGNAGLAMHVTAVRVPMFFGSALSIGVETEQPLGAAAAIELLRSAPGLVLEEDAYPTPAEVVGSEATYVGRVRDDLSAENALALWVTLDNVRKGGALNAVQIAEVLVRDYL